MLASSPDLAQKSLQIKEDDKFFSRLLSKERSMAPSFRVSGAVPFVWESQPGTPKHTSCETSLPPLTPPPSFYYCNSNTKPIKKHSRSSLLRSLFPRIHHFRKTHEPSSPTSSIFSSHSSITVPTTRLNYYGQSRISSASSSFDSKGDNEERGALGSPTSTLCFGYGRKARNGFQGCYSVAIVKKALLSMVGH